VKIRTRFSLLMVILSFGLAGAFIKSEDIFLRAQLVTAQEAWISTLVRAVAGSVALDVINEEHLNTQELLKGIVSEEEALSYIYVTNFEGHVFTHTFEGGFPVALAERLLISKGDNALDSFSTDLGDLVEYDAPLIEGMGAHLHIGVNRRVIDAIVSEAQKDVAPIVLGGVIVSLLFAFYIGNRISAPLQSLSAQFRRFGKTGEAAKLESKTSEPDIQRLADAYNDMFAARSKVEIERERALTAAQKANKAKSDFLAAMSHELRTPLNAILGFSNVISEQMLGPIGVEKYSEYAGDIHKSAEHLHSLVNELLDLSAIEAEKFSVSKEELSVTYMFEQAVRIVKGQAEAADISLLLNVPEDIPNFYADKRAIKQVLLNVLGNAVKFTQRGGKVTLAAEATTTQITLTIEDTGQGIAPEKVASLKEPFTRAEEDPLMASEGWGLGLAISNSLIELHQGTLKIESTEGKGTKVTIVLPVRHLQLVSANGS